jgi:hypothetical protein
MSEKLWNQPWRQVYLDHPDHTNLTEICVCCEEPRPEHKDGCYLERMEAVVEVAEELGLYINMNAENLGDIKIGRRVQQLTQEVGKALAALEE